MTGWWMVVFWLLLVPLIIVELVVYLKSKKFYWLIYALAIFTYVISVCYTVDVFDLGKNAVILVLLASAALMFIVGRQLGKKVKPQKRVRPCARSALIALGAVLIIVFVVSVVFGKLERTILPETSVDVDKILVDNPKDQGPYPASSVTIMRMTYTNTFILPVPVKQEYYKVCLVTESGAVQLSQSYAAEDRFNEVAARSTKTVEYKVMPNQVYDPTAVITPKEVLVYATSQEKQWEPCDADAGAPLYTIPVV